MINDAAGRRGETYHIAHCVRCHLGQLHGRVMTASLRGTCSVLFPFLYFTLLASNGRRRYAWTVLHQLARDREQAATR